MMSTRTAAWDSLNPTCLHCGKRSFDYSSVFDEDNHAAYVCPGREWNTRTKHGVFQNEREHFTVAMITRGDQPSVFSCTGNTLGFEREYSCQVELRMLRYVVATGRKTGQSFYGNIRCDDGIAMVCIQSIEQYYGLLHIRHRLRQRARRRRLLPTLIMDTPHFDEVGICKLIAEYSLQQ